MVPLHCRFVSRWLRLPASRMPIGVTFAVRQRGLSHWRIFPVPVDAPLVSPWSSPHGTPRDGPGSSATQQCDFSKFAADADHLPSRLIHR